MRSLWLVAGLLSLLLGIVGAFLPLLPTTPFLLLSAFAFSRSSPAFHRWLVDHETFGPPIRDWERDRAISRKGKKAATLAIALTPILTMLFSVPLWALFAQIAVLAAVLAFIWTRNEPPGSPRS